MSEPVRVAQLWDTHFLEADCEPEGGHAYDTSSAFDSVVDHLGQHDHLDMVVVTGDVADHGRAEQYQLAVEAFNRFTVPVSVCPGNHDFDVPFRAAHNGGQISAPREVRLANWAFLFVDSNSGAMLPGDDGVVDPPGEQRLHGNGLLSAAEAAWVSQTCATTDAEHVFIWLHHPPAVPVPWMLNEPYTRQWNQLLAELPTVRGLGAGHTHIPDRFEVAGRPVVVAPSLKNNFDLQAQTWLPPGYRTYEFAPDGTVTSELHLVDGDPWPRRPLGRALRSLFAGELTMAELNQIVARKAAEAAARG